MSGGGSEKDLFEQSLQHIADDIGMKMGEMEEFMAISEDFMSNVDLEQGIFDEKGMKLLESWESNQSSLLNTDKEKIIKDANDPNKNWDSSVERVSSSGSSFSDFFNK